jgi:transposase
VFFHQKQETNMTTTREVQGIKSAPVLHLAFELGLGQWKLAFTVGLGQAPRFRTVVARDREAVLDEVARAKERFELPADAPVVSCYEAGRDGFWLHRWLVSVGVENVIVDSSSIEVNRKQRRAKSDQLDASALVRLLVRYQQGEKKVWSVVRPPSDTDEDQRQLHRDLMDRKDDQTRVTNQMKGLLYGHGLVLSTVGEKFLEWLSAARRWDGSAVPGELQARLRRQFAHWQLLHGQIKSLDVELQRRIRQGDTPQVELVRKLLKLVGIGPSSAWTLVKELFAWRGIKNRKELGALVGLTPTPYNSGMSHREQGISKAGNKRLRRLLVELGWSWVRHQKTSELAQWFERRFGKGRRQRKIGIVAVARKLLILLWRYVEKDELPLGVKFGPWEKKVNRWSSWEKGKAPGGATAA